jgi:putative Holliday junction resolvase
MRAAAYNRAVAGEKKPPSVSRALALDIGSKRIGLAVTDELGITAQGLRTLDRTSRRHDLEVLKKIARKHNVTEVVIGRPLHMTGDQSVQSKRIEEFGKLVGESLGLPVHYIDERLTSWEANEILDQEKLSRTERKGKVDQIAAVLILQAFLDSRNGDTKRTKGTED